MGKDEDWVFAVCQNLLGYKDKPFDQEIQTMCLAHCRNIISRAITDPGAIPRKVAESVEKAEHCFQAGFPEEGFDDLRDALTLLSKWRD